MKKIIYILFVVCLLATMPAVNAQETNRGIFIENLNTEITGETLDIRLDLRATGLEMKCDGQLILEFAVENDERRLVLPVVVYSGAQRYRYERRRELLSDNYIAEPYQIYKGVRRNQSNNLEYKLSIPYYTWMEHAGITYREYVHDCSGDRQVAGGFLIEDLNPAPVVVEPEIWKPDSTLFANLVSFLIPEVEEVKARASMIELNIGFPVNVTEVRPSFGNNQYELSRADSLIAALSSNEHIDIRGVSVKGYASPDGRYSANERLAKGRSEGFKQYLIKNYPGNTYIRNAATMWVAEDWEGFARLVEASSLPNRQEVLAVALDGSMAPDTKEQVLQKIGVWSEVYKVILEDLFPKLRRIELLVDYTIHNLTDNEARELLYTAPDMLSLDEINRVARYYEPGSRQYREVYEIAALQFPDDIVANNNAAAALLQEGNTEKALPYLEKTRDSDVSLINYGAYYYITGDLETALEYFNKAKDAGIGQAEHNLRLAAPGEPTN